MGKGAHDSDKAETVEEIEEVYISPEMGGGLPEDSRRPRQLWRRKEQPAKGELHSANQGG